MKQEFTRIAVKVGSNVLTRRDGTLDVTRMSALVDQIAELHKAGVEVILISSGAVASGRSEIRTLKKLDSIDQRQLFSAVGQAKLINRYYELFRDHGIPVGQVLTTKESFGTRRHYLNQKNCMTVMLENGVIPIVNENDTISVTELMFTDNDELSGLIASMMDTQALIILSNIDGIYNGSPNDPSSSVLREIGHGNKNFAAQLPVTVVHPVRRDRVGKQRRRAQRAVGLIGDDFPRNQIVVPVGRPPVDYGYDPVIARPQFEIERARRKIPGDLQFGPWPRLCVEQDGLRRVHDPAGVRLFQDQQPGRVPEPLRVGGGARHGYERDVRADGFQPERDFDAFFPLRGRVPEGFPF